MTASNQDKAKQCQAYADRARELAREKPQAAGHYNGVASEWAAAAKTFERQG